MFSADDLIAAFGDQAWHRGVKMAVEALLGGDNDSFEKLADACAELCRRGYHKKPEKEAAGK